MKKRSINTAAVLLACAAGWAAGGGCGKGSGGGSTGSSLTLNSMVRKLSGPSPSEYVAMAFDPNDPDRRREGILGLSKHDWGLKEPYLKGYAAMLKTDRDPLVRAAAARALGKAKDPTYLEDVVKALYDPAEPVRQDAATALDSLTGEPAVEHLRNRSIQDSSQDVRAGCAKALRHYRRPDVVRTLVECLSDKAFCVNYQAHASLVELTGQDLGYQPQDWGPVANQPLAPKPPEERSDDWWQRMWRWGRADKSASTKPAGTRPASTGPAVSPPGAEPPATQPGG